MKPQNKFIQSWQQAVENYGAVNIAIKARLDVRTIKNATQGKDIDPATFEKINAAIVYLKAKEKRTLKQLEE